MAKFTKINANGLGCVFTVRKGSMNKYAPWQADAKFDDGHLTVGYTAGFRTKGEVVARLNMLIDAASIKACGVCGEKISKEETYKPEWADKACGICVACENEALANS